MLINLLHYSDKKNLTEINPNRFAKNYYTLNDYKLSNIKRSFFYVNDSEIELRFRGKYCYRTTIDSSKVYNITENKLNITFNNINDLLLKIKSMGYLGIIYTIDNLQIANIFKSLKVKKTK